jgi:hypothetical protein
MNLEHLLRESVGRYRALLHLQAEVNGALKKARPDEIEALAEHLESLQQQAARVDLCLLPLLEQAGETAAASPLFRERQALLEECARQIRLLLPGAEAHKAVFAAQLMQLKEGRAALAGYESGERNRGNSVNRQV